MREAQTLVLRPLDFDASKYDHEERAAGHIPVQGREVRSEPLLVGDGNEPRLTAFDLSGSAQPSCTANALSPVMDDGTRFRAPGGGTRPLSPRELEKACGGKLEQPQNSERSLCSQESSVLGSANDLAHSLRVCLTG